MLAQNSLIEFVVELAQFTDSFEQSLRARQSRCKPAAAARAPSEPTCAPPAPKLEAGPWRSLGGYLNYAEWAERDRFVELDAALARMGPAEQSEEMPID